jgi:hypothetical protein
MATNLMDVFGATPEELEYQKRQEQEKAARLDYRNRLSNAGQGLGMYSGLARAGVETGESLRNLRLFGESPSPEMERATVMKQILKKYESQDISNPDVIAKMSQELGQSGYPREAYQLMEQAKAITAKKIKTRQDAEKARLDERKTLADINKTQADIAKIEKELNEEDRGDYLTDKAMTEFKEDAKHINTFKGLNATSDFSYFQLTRPQLAAAKITPGTVAAMSGKTVEQVQDAVLWWTQYDAFLAMVRNKLYGSALTKTEIENFERAVVTATTDEETAQRMLAEQLEIAQIGYRKNAEFSHDQGRNIEGVYELIGEVRPMSGVTVSPEEFEIISVE